MATVHSTLTGNELHEPKGADTATLGSVYISDGAGSGSWQGLEDFVEEFGIPLPAGYIQGFTISNDAGDLSNDITIQPGVCRNSTNTANIQLAAAITKQINVAWAVGDDQGGLDTGAVANGAYHLYIIANSGTGVADATFSTSATSPVLSGGFDVFRRIASFRRLAGANQVMATTETAGGGLEVLITPVVDISETIATTDADVQTLNSLPSTITVDAYITGIFRVLAVGDREALLLTSTAQADTTPVVDGINTVQSSSTAADDDVDGNFQMRIRAINRQIRSRATATGPELRIITHGWIDPRRV